MHSFGSNLKSFHEIPIYLRSDLSVIIVCVFCNVPVQRMGLSIRGFNCLQSFMLSFSHVRYIKSGVVVAVKFLTNFFPSKLT